MHLNVRYASAYRESALGAVISFRGSELLVTKLKHIGHWRLLIGPSLNLLANSLPSTLVQTNSSYPTFRILEKRQLRIYNTWGEHCL